jgi:predicted amidohydrolase
MTLKVATIQMISNNNDYDGNRLRAEKSISDAVRQGAELILLPEFALAGYLYTDEFWSMAEPLKGKTYKWQKSLSQTHGVYIGHCILEKKQSDFYDTFILTGPGQNEIWTHRKIEAPGHESYLFKGVGINSNVFETPIGKIGVVICFDSAKAHTLSSLINGNAEIVLIAYSYPSLPQYFSKKDRSNWVETYRKAPPIYSKYLQAPVVVSNKTGHFSSPLRMGIADFDARFTGGSSIFNKEGNLLMRMAENQAGVLVSEVSLGKQTGSEKNSLNPKGWLLPYSSKNKVLMEIIRALGRIRYRFCKKRRLAATGNTV